MQYTVARKNLYTHYKSFLNVKGVFKYHFNAILTCAFLIIRLLRFDGRLLKIVIPAEYALF
jgi:hypothetical protein